MRRVLAGLVPLFEQRLCRHAHAPVASV